MRATGGHPTPHPTPLLAAAGAVRWGRFSGVAVSARLGPGAPVRASL